MHSMLLTNRKLALGDRLLRMASDADSLFPGDFQLVASKDGGRHAVHSFVLADASSYFHALVTNSDFVESRTREAELPVDSETLRLLLEWIYTRNELVMSVDQAVPLYIAAKQFLLDELARPLRAFLLHDAAVLSFLGSEVFLNFTPIDVLGLADILEAEEMLPFRPNLLRHLHRWVKRDSTRRMDSIFKVYDELARGDEAESNMYLFGPWSVPVNDSSSSSASSSASLSSSSSSSDVLCYRFANDRLEEHRFTAPDPRLAIWYGHLPDNLCFMRDGHLTVLDSGVIRVLDCATGKSVRDIVPPFEISARTDVGLAHFERYLFLWIGADIYALQDDGATFVQIANAGEKIRRMFVRRYRVGGSIDFIMQADVRLGEDNQPIYGSNRIMESQHDRWTAVEQGSLDLLLLGVAGDKAIIYRTGHVLVRAGTNLLGSIPVPLLQNGYSIAYASGQVVIAGPTNVEVIDMQTFNRRSIPLLGPRGANRLRVETLTVTAADRRSRDLADIRGEALPDKRVSTIQ